jgi:sugar lactone lactonase YvrE
MIASLRARARSLAALAVFACATFAATFASAQSVTTIAGGLVGDGLTPAEAALSGPAQMAFDASGNLYVAEFFSHRVRKITPAGVVSTFAGTGQSGFSGDGGAATSAKLNAPWGLVFDASGNLYISEYRGNRIRKVTPGGVISTYAGDGTSATLNAPRAMAIASNGTIYVSETTVHRVKKIVGGVISPFAGTGSAGSTGDSGPATSAKLYSPMGLLAQADGSVLIADLNNNRIRIVDSAGNIGTWRNINLPYGFARDGSGVLHVSTDYGVFKDNGVGFDKIVGENDYPWGFYGDGGAATAARLNFPYHLLFASDGKLLISDMYNHRIRTVSGGVINTYVGPGRPTEGGTAVGARVGSPGGLAYDPSGNLYVSERYLNVVRKITPAGVISTVAGSGWSMGSPDPEATGPTGVGFYEPRGVAVNAAGDLLVVVTNSNQVFKFSSTGVVSTFVYDSGMILPDQIFVAPNG